MGRAALGVVLGLVARLWHLSLRLDVVVEDPASLGDPRPWVLAFFHGQQFGLLAWRRRRRTAVLVSLSNDGDVQARALPRLGLVVRRGSTSRGGAKGLAAIVRLLRRGLDAAFAVDGPRGPAGHVHPGALVAAERSGGVVVPIACASSCAVVLEKAWDRYEIPLPFSRVVVVVGTPLAASSREEGTRAIATALTRLRSAAEAKIVVASRAIADAGEKGKERSLRPYNRTRTP